MAGLDLTLAIAMGVGLAAAVGFALATGELGGALVVSLLALAAPFAAVGPVALFCRLTVPLVRRLFRRARPADSSGVR